MNLQLHHVVADITGATGLRIIRAILAGERDPKALAALRHYSCHSSAETIAKALTGSYRAEHLFALEQALALYTAYRENGRIIASGEPAAIRANEEVRQAYLGEQEAVQGAVHGLDRPARSVDASRPATAGARCCSASRSAIAPGEMVTLMGRNGMGKTTTVRSIMGLTPAMAGVDPLRRPGDPRTARPIASPSSASAWCRRAGRSFPI